MKYGKLVVVIGLVFFLSSCGQSNDTTVASSDDTKRETAVSEEISDDAGRETAVSEEISSHAETETGSALKSDADAVVNTDEIAGTVFFGNYPQLTEDVEPIEWIVLDSQEDRVLLLAKECIESLPWHNSHESITWDNCDLRMWLNGDFFRMAFTAEEQDSILLTELDNGDDLNYGTSVGENTQDHVFLLSGAEIERYLPLDENRTAKPTKYAISHGAYTNGNGDCAWWLRSPGMTETSPAYLSSGGSIGNRAHEVDETIIGVRPAIWVQKERLK